MTGMEEARQEMATLVAKYQNLSEKDVKKYTEADTRRVFILPLFRALGWDVYSRDEVTEEERASRGRVDYAFRIRGIPKFFLEAKALRADLDSPEYAKQVINYAYHKSVTWAVLTDFEGLKVFNAEIKEANVSQARLFELRWNEYLSRFDQLSLLSREAFEQGLLDKEALKWSKRTRKTPVGQQLFSDLVAWRELLHKYLSSYNKSQPPHLIDEAVQRILDRLIFIRTCEDRGLEPPTLRPLVREWHDGARKDLVQELKQIWQGFDSGYNSRLFAHHVADELNCEHTPFVEVIEGLHATRDRSIEYDFNAIDADVLGGIYEQYLEHLLKRSGEEVEITAERRKRKAQGIYYTPKFVVRYIVENTLGRALEGKSLQEARKIRVLDPACGSGSFLVEALSYLERHWQKQKWTQQPKPGEDARQTDFFDYVTKLQFLTENLYGVDLDAQAVEIAQLNLLLRCLNQRALLPDLMNNIRQGNSLVSGTEEELRPYFGNAWQEKKPFDWKQEFNKAMGEGGFDVVIGNPPYGIVFDDPTKTYLEEEYPTFKRNNDLFVAFIQKAIQLLKNGGLFSFIVPNTFLIGPYFDGIKEYMLEHTKIVKRLDFGIHQVFPEPNVFNAILVLQKEKDANGRNANIVEYIDALAADITQPQNLQVETRSQYELSDLRWQSIHKIVAKVSKLEPKLGTIASVKDVGLNYWTIGRGKTRGGSIADRILYEGTRQNAQDLPFLKGRNIERYQCEFGNRWLRHDYQKLLDPEHDVFRYSPEFLLQGPKIIYRQTADRITATIDTEDYLIDKTLHCIVVQDAYSSLFNLKYILGILNSKLATYIYRDLVKEEGRLFAQVKTFNMKRIPIRRIDFDNPAEKKMHDNLVALVDEMLELNKRLGPIRNTPCNEQDDLLRKIERTDREIDNLVYDLYGLTKEERGIVEESA